MNAAITIQDIEGTTQLQAVEELQRQVWGVPDLDVVPLTHLIATQTAGGVLLGAFDGESLVGFVYGFVGWEEGEVSHHSHMLAVKPEYRNLKLGMMLKLAQRQRVLNQGIKTITWTFDPLQSLNAHFNISKLGAISDRYYINFYGADAPSFLHRTGTDRLWVKWLLDSPRVHERLANSAPAPELQQVTPLIEIGPDDSPQTVNKASEVSGEPVLIEIPGNINELQKRSTELAVTWRDTTRSAFQEALACGYVVMDFHRQSRGSQRYGVYVLSRDAGGVDK